MYILDTTYRHEKLGNICSLFMTFQVFNLNSYMENFLLFELHFTLATTYIFFVILFSKPKSFLTFQASEKVQKSVFQIIDNYQKKFKTNKIFLSSKQINVYWAHVTVVKAELICFEDLLVFPQANWKYIITTAGSELPNYSHKMLRSDINIKSSLSFNQNTFMVHFVKYNLQIGKTKSRSGSTLGRRYKTVKLER